MLSVHVSQGFQSFAEIDVLVDNVTIDLVKILFLVLVEFSQLSYFLVVLPYLKPDSLDFFH